MRSGQAAAHQHPVRACIFIEDEGGRVAVAAVEGAATVGIQAIVKTGARHGHTGEAARFGQNAPCLEFGYFDPLRALLSSLHFHELLTTQGRIKWVMRCRAIMPIDSIDLSGNSGFSSSGGPHP